MEPLEHIVDRNRVWERLGWLEADVQQDPEKWESYLRHFGHSIVEEATK